jgi:hypothetical protein
MYTVAIRGTEPPDADGPPGPGRLDKVGRPAPTMCRPRKAGEMQDGTHDHVRSYHLHRLATALDTEGFHATVKTSYPAALHVFIPGASMLAESIDCTPGTDDHGRLCWFYRWSWGEVLHAAEDPPGAAAKIAEVLASR